VLLYEFIYETNILIKKKKKVPESEGKTIKHPACMGTTSRLLGKYLKWLLEVLRDCQVFNNSRPTLKNLKQNHCLMCILVSQTTLL